MGNPRLDKLVGFCFGCYATSVVTFPTQRLHQDLKAVPVIVDNKNSSSNGLFSIFFETHPTYQCNVSTTSRLICV
ncbi:hypothetical protein D3C87_1361230 [compost metagenome]